ncbi:hypothetical protein C8R44DRAFT_741917 [Mycena epipterygia]|nr:hypothetical protein C8R44DRAFT_741917 [Mycena epipterygia]
MQARSSGIRVIQYCCRLTTPLGLRTPTSQGGALSSPEDLGGPSLVGVVIPAEYTKGGERAARVPDTRVRDPSSCWSIGPDLQKVRWVGTVPDDLRPAESRQTEQLLYSMNKNVSVETKESGKTQERKTREHAGHSPVSSRSHSVGSRAFKARQTAAALPRQISPDPEGFPGLWRLMEVWDDWCWISGTSTLAFLNHEPERCDTESSRAIFRALNLRNAAGSLASDMVRTLQSSCGFLRSG